MLLPPLTRRPTSDVRDRSEKISKSKTERMENVESTDAKKKIKKKTKTNVQMCFPVVQISTRKSLHSSFSQGENMRKSLISR